MGQRVGYKRVSTFEQRTDRQLEGVELDKVRLSTTLQTKIPGLQGGVRCLISHRYQTPDKSCA